MTTRVLLILIVLTSGVGGCAQIEAGTEGVRQLFDAISARPRKAVLKTTDQYFPDERRDGINELVARPYGRTTPYTAQYANLATSDPDYLVRATAIRALNRARQSDATSLFINALNDESELVRLEATKALVNMPDEKSVPNLVKLVTNPNENRDVRIAAAEALKHYRNPDAARALIGQLSGREFGLAWQAHKSLVRITGEDLRYDEAAWLTYMAAPERPFG
jgi:hypothetical protein